MDIVEYTRTRSKELADYLEECACSPLTFEGNDPLSHSSSNHVHLWYLEYYSERNNWINVEYKLAFISYILKTWKNRIKGFFPYQSQGYRIYVYGDLAPTISVVANTEIGFPYKHILAQVVFVDDISDILKKYEDSKWSQHFSDTGNMSHDKLLKAISSNNGSIGKPTASKLGIKVAELRRLIINMGLSSRVNDIRKKHQRRPADFSHVIDSDHQILFYESILPPKFS